MGQNSSNSGNEARGGASMNGGYHSGAGGANQDRGGNPQMGGGGAHGGGSMAVGGPGNPKMAIVKALTRTMPTTYTAAPPTVTGYGVPQAIPGGWGMPGFGTSDVSATANNAPIAHGNTYGGRSRGLRGGAQPGGGFGVAGGALY